MLLQIGQRVRPTDLVDSLHECHRRIRHFLGVAHRLAISPPLDASETRDLADAIARYFQIGFAHHVADEHDSIAPRLVGRTEALDTALARMHADHDEIRAIDVLIEICREVARDPRRLDPRRAELAAASERLTLELEAHLGLEELVIFPALRELSSRDRMAIQEEMRLRREASATMRWGAAGDAPPSPP
jgi:hemerythrin-like domain-containing protein